MRAAVFFVVVGALACAPPAEVADKGEDDIVGEPCPAVGPGLTLEETGPFGGLGAIDDEEVVLMGGGAEVDRAAVSFVNSAGGGDVLVLRATGSTSSYTSYFDGNSGELDIAVPPHAVATIRIDDAGAGDDAGLLCRVQRAQAIWLAGGDQSDYLLSWPAALHDALRVAHLQHASIGGTSAGAMALSAYAYDASDGGIGSEDALANPASTSVSVSPLSSFFGALVDTHFQARDREGRLLAFVAHAQQLNQSGEVVGVGLDEGAALVAAFGGPNGRVLADDGAAVWRYRLEGARVVAGEPLSVERVRLRVFVDGDDFSLSGDAFDEEFSVVDGVIVR